MTNQIGEIRAAAGLVRLPIIILLNRNPLAVSEIAEAMGFSVSRVSHQLRILKDAGIVTGKREGKAVRYRVVPNVFTADNVTFRIE